MHASNYNAANAITATTAIFSFHGNFRIPSIPCNSLSFILSFILSFLSYFLCFVLNTHTHTHTHTHAHTHTQTHTHTHTHTPPSDYRPAAHTVLHRDIQTPRRTGGDINRPERA